MIDLMQKLLKLHRGLLQLAKQKTEAIKKKRRCYVARHDE